MHRKSAVNWMAAAAVALSVAISLPAHAGKTLDTMKQRGALVCGVNVGLAGFSAADSQGNWTGLDVDVCKALAAAVLNDPTKVKWVPLTAQARFTALQSGEVDILSRNTTWTLTRDASLGLDFMGVTYYDGQGFMVPRKTKITSAKAAQGDRRLRAIRHHHGEEPERLLQVQRPSDEAGRVRRSGSVGEGVLLRTLPGLYDGRFGPCLDSQQGSDQSRRLRDPAGLDLEGAPWHRQYGAATTSGSPSRSG